MISSGQKDPEEFIEAFVCKVDLEIRGGVVLVETKKQKHIKQSQKSIKKKNEWI